MCSSVIGLFAGGKLVDQSVSIRAAPDIPASLCAVPRPNNLSKNAQSKVHPRTSLPPPQTYCSFVSFSSFILPLLESVFNGVNGDRVGGYESITDPPLGQRLAERQAQAEAPERSRVSSGIKSRDDLSRGRQTQNHRHPRPSISPRPNPTALVISQRSRRGEPSGPGGNCTVSQPASQKGCSIREEMRSGSNPFFDEHLRRLLLR